MELLSRDEIVSRLSITPFAINKDKHDMLEWLEGRISDQELTERFRRNNDIEEDIPVDLMIDFATSLGYFRMRSCDGEPV